MYSLKNNIVVTDASFSFIFFFGFDVWSENRFYFKQENAHGWILHWFFPSPFYNSEWSPPHVRSKIEVYRNQPRSIVDYEPGFSSIAFQESKVVSTKIILFCLYSNHTELKNIVSMIMYWIVRMQTIWMVKNSCFFYVLSLLHFIGMDNDILELHNALFELFPSFLCS